MPAPTPVPAPRSEAVAAPQTYAAPPPVTTPTPGANPLVAPVANVIAVSKPSSPEIDGLVRQLSQPNENRLAATPPSSSAG